MIRCVSGTATTLREGDLDRLLEASGICRGDLVAALQAIQLRHHYLPAPLLDALAARWQLPLADITSVATFYNQFRFAPVGEHVIEVCRGTACHVKQSLALAQHLERRLHLRDDGNSADGRYTVVRVVCLGACSIAPVIKLDGAFYGHLTTEKLDALLDELEADGDAAKPDAFPSAARAPEEQRDEAA